jgi:hypothetical protein
VTDQDISLLMPGGELLAGDLLMGGYLGGYVRPRRAGYPYFLDDLEQEKQSIRKILTLPLATDPIKSVAGPGVSIALSNKRRNSSRPAGDRMPMLTPKSCPLG